MVDGDLVAGRVALADKVVADQRPLKRVRDLKVEDPKAEAFLEFARNTVGAASKHFPAPLKCVEAVEAAVKQAVRRGHAPRARELHGA